MPSLKSLLQAALLLVVCRAYSSGLTSSDGDGIPDDWKKNGIQVTFADGTSQHLDLGLQTGRKAIVVWVDWMAAGAGHTHRPIKAPDSFPGSISSHVMENRALGRIQRAFEFAPIDRDKQPPGIQLVVIFASAYFPEPINEQEFLGDAITGADGKQHYDWSAFDAIRHKRFPVSPVLFGHGFHYAMFIHKLGGNGWATASGLSNGIPGDEFIVALGSTANGVGDADQQAGTFMHELGHNLSLDHGGFEDVLNKPNYLSVMNYMFQMVGTSLAGSYGHFDYSSAEINIDEAHLDTRKGIAADPNMSILGSAHICFDGTYNLIWHLTCPVD